MKIILHTREYLFSLTSADVPCHIVMFCTILIMCIFLFVITIFMYLQHFVGFMIQNLTEECNTKY